MHYKSAKKTMGLDMCMVSRWVLCSSR